MFLDYVSDDTSVPRLQPNHEVSPITYIDINAAIVFNKLVNLKTDKSSRSGPDGWPILALKEKALQISTLAIIFKKSFHQQMIPDICKRGHITPIIKRQSAFTYSNYRPVSLTFPIAKVMESIIKDNISSYMCNNNLFSLSQYIWFYHKKILYQPTALCIEILVGHNVWMTNALWMLYTWTSRKLLIRFHISIY